MEAPEYAFNCEAAQYVFPGLILPPRQPLFLPHHHHAEATLNSATQSANQYVEMELQDTLLNAALIGIGGSLGLAFGIILITTRDVVISILSIISIGGVVVSLICMLVWFGWSLGVIESIAMTILVGLSVDYTIHLAQAYRESAAHNRRDRLIDCLTSMGISVLSASATSILR